MNSRTLLPALITALLLTVGFTAQSFAQQNRPDLAAGSVSVSSASVVAGASFTINATVSNVGNAASAATTLTYYLSVDANINLLDTNIASDPVSALAANGTSSESALVSIAEAGTYWVGACVATVSDEANADNNCSTGVQVTVTPGPDLTVLSVSASSAAVEVGESFTINALLLNIGSAASAATTLTYYRSADATITTDDTELADGAFGALAVGGFASENGSVSIDTTGTWWVGACLATVAGESNEDNNCSPVGAQVNVTEAPASGPDLTVDSVTVSSASVVVSAPFTINATVNNGANAASAATTLTYYRSSDATISTLDTQIATDPVSALVAKGSSAENASVSIDIPDSTYWVGACVATVEDESDTDNNCSTGVQVTITTGPDLAVDSVTVSNASVVVDESFTINATVQNDGGGASAATTLTYYRSADATISTLDTEIATGPVGALAADGSSERNASVSIAADGTYWVGACVAPVQYEELTNNNCSTGVQVTVTTTPVPDLTVDSVSVSSASVEVDESFTINATVNNVGNAAAAATTLTYYRSADATISTLDTQMATDPVIALAANGSSTENASVSIDTTGTWWVGACVPTAQDEDVTNNNCSTGVQVTVTSGPDLAVESVSVSNAGADVEVNESFTISATVNNVGSAASAATTLTYYRSTDSTISTLDTAIATDPISALAANGSSAQNAAVSIATAGAWWVGACVPTVQDEANTDNNCSTGVRVRVTAKPDLTVDSVSVSSASVVAGASFTIDATVNNIGNAASLAGTLTYYRSANDTISRFGTEMATDPVIALAATESSEENASVSIATTGTWWVGACVTPQVEVLINNNCSTGVQVIVTAAPILEPDLTVDSASVSNASVEVDESFTIDATVNNIGNTVSAATTLTYYRSVDATIDTLDTQMATDPVIALAANGSSEEDTSVSIATTGTWWVGACVATVQDEADADNNCSTGVQVTVTAEPDLTVDSVSVSSANVNVDESFTINATVNNVGNAASAATTLTYHRSTNSSIGRSDTEIATDPVIALAANGSSEENASVSIATTGTYWVGACVATVQDEDVTNNNCSTGVQVTVATAPPPPTVDISIGNASADEGDDIRFTVALSAQLLEARTLNIGYTGGSGDTGASLDDLGSDRPTTLMLPTGTMSVDLDVPTVDDDDFENNETFTVTLSLPDPPDDPMNTLNITTSTVTGTINNNDEAPATTVSIEDASVAENGGNAEFTVSVDRAVDSDVTLAVAYTAGTATLATDLGTRPDTVRITANTTEATLLVPITNDNIVEGNETFTVTISEGTTRLPDGVTIGTDNTATGTITDADTASVLLRSTAPPGSEGGTITFTVNLDNSLAETFSLGWAATDGTATVADDLDDRTGTVEIPANARTATFGIPVTNDNEVEGSETFTVALTGAPTGLVNIAPSRVTVDRSPATGTIEDDDEAEVTLSPPTATAAEDGTFTYTVSLSVAVDEAVTVRWTATDGTATVAEDLQATTSTVTFNANTNANQTFTISPVNDTEDEDNETFTVTLAADTANPLPTGVTIGTANSSTATITDNDDTPPPADAMVSIADASAVAEEDAGSASFRVSLVRAVDSDVVLAVAYGAGSAALADLGSGRPTTLTIDRGETEATLAVPIVNDTIVEGDETFTVTITTATAGVGIGDGVATGTITDSDTAVISHQSRRGETSEGGSSSPLIALSAPVSRPITITWTAIAGDGDTATVEDDLQAPHTGTVTFPANDNTGRNYTIRAVDDDLDEPDETFTVTIEATGALPARVTIDPDRDSRAVTILDRDDPPPPPVDDATVNIADAAAVAEDAGNVSFTVSLDAAVSGDVVLGVTYGGGTDNPATPVDDLGSDRPTTVTIDEGETEATLSVPIFDDDIVEGDETFTVTLAINDAPEGVSIGDGVATGTITEDDTAEVTLSPPTARAAENGTFTYTVSLSAAADEAVTVRWTATDGTATVADDLQEETGTVEFAATSSANQTFTIAVTGDDLDEDDETFTVTLGPDTEGNNPLPTGVTIGTDNSSTATITDNDEAPPEDDAMVRIGDRTVGEAVGTASFSVTLSRAVSSPVVLAVTYADGSAEVATDLGTPLRSTVTIAADTTEATIAVPIVDDDIFEGDETFTVTVSEPSDTPLPDGVSIANGEATGTITDNDGARAQAAVVSIVPVAGSVAEGQTVAFAVRLSHEVDAPVTIRWTAAGGTATLQGPEADLRAGAATTGTVTFAPGDTVKRFTVATRADDLVEGSETFEVTITAEGELPDGVSISRTANALLATITETAATTVSIAPSVLSEEEGDEFTFAVRVEQRVAQPVAVRWSAAGGTATLTGPGSDLQDGEESSGTVSIEAGTWEATFTLDTREDAGVEVNETFTVTISASGTLPAGVSISTTANRAMATILNDDIETKLSIDDASVTEGGMLRFPYTLSEAVNTAVSFNYATANGTATVANADYTPTTDGQASIPANTTEGVIEVPTTADEIVEADETLTVTLINIERADSGVVSFINDVATGTIVNDDFSEVSIAPSEVAAAEGETFAFEARLDKAVDEDVTVSWTVAGAGVNPATLTGDNSDLRAGVATSGTVTFAAGDTAPKPLTIATRTDELAEGDETFEVKLAADSLPTAVSLDTAPATGTITDLTSVLIEPRRSGAASALRRHVGRFETMTSRVVQSRLSGRSSQGLSVSGNPGNFGNPGNYGNPGNFGSPGNYGSSGNYGNPGSYGSLGNYGNPGSYGSPGNYGNPSNYGNPGNFGTPGNFGNFSSSANFGNQANTGNGAVAIGGVFAETGLGAWADGAYTGFRGRATGRQGDIYGGVDYLGGGGNWLIGALVGQDFADLDAGAASYRANYTQVGAYGGVRLSPRLIFDGAAAYGIATPEVRQDDVSASYDASRITLRAGLTGDIGLAYGLGGGTVTIVPQVNVGWAREQLGGFTDSAGGIAGRDTLELGRLSAGPRITWDRDGSQLVGGVRLQWDFVQPDDIAETLSTVVDIGLLFALTPALEVGLTGDVDGIGIADDFLTYGGGIQLRLNFARNIAMALFGDVDRIGALDGRSNPGGRLEITIGR